MSENTASRRAALAGGAAIAGGVLLGGQGTADASNGKPLLVGRGTNTASAGTKLTMSGNAQALTVINKKKGSSAHAIAGQASYGYGLIGDSAHHHGAVIRAHSAGKWALVAENVSNTAGSGGGIAVSGGKGPGLRAHTNNGKQPAILAENLGSNSAYYSTPAIIGLAGSGAAAALKSHEYLGAAGQFAGADHSRQLGRGLQRLLQGVRLFRFGHIVSPIRRNRGTQPSGLRPSCNLKLEVQRDDEGVWGPFGGASL